MKSTITTMTVCLCGLSILVGAALAGIDNLTREPIARARANARNEAIAAVLPQFDNEPADEAIQTDDGFTLYPASYEGKRVGVAVEAYSDNGFSGRFTILVGIDTAGDVTGYRVLSHSETPGLGARMDTWFCETGTAHDIIGKSGIMKVKADGGDVDAITGATITSRAFLEAVSKAARNVSEYMNDFKSVSE